MKKIPFHLAILLVFFTNLLNAQYVLTLDFEQMDPYLGKRLVTRVVENGSGKEVGRKTIDAIENSVFSIELYVLLQGRSYTIDFYVDVNESGDYDAPPTDHAWRRNLNNATQHVTITFIPDLNFTDTGLPDPFPFSTYDGVWGGKWHNLTFGSTDSIESLFQITCDSFFGYFTTAGVFGNPAKVEFDTSGILPDDEGGTDTIILQLDPPWTGQITIINGFIHGNLTQGPAGLEFFGTVGATQILCLYTVTLAGNAFANGYFYIRELDVNSSTPEIAIELVDNADVSCFDAGDGFLFTSAIGGMPGYTYEWSNGETTPQISNLAGGDYALTVTDALGCTSEATYSVGEPEQIVITWNTTQISCSGLCNGSIDVIMIGGVPPYTFSWSNGLTTEDAFDLCGDTYELTVTDATGCEASAPISVFEPAALELNILEAIGESCFEACDGSIVVEVNGGIPPYNFNPTDLCSGIYLLVVTDAVGCTAEESVFITAGEEIVIDAIQIQDATDGLANGSFEVFVTTGTPPLVYSINGAPFQASNVFMNLPAGEYCVLIRDANGCEIKSDTFSIQNLTATINLKENFIFYPNPATSWLYFEADNPLAVDILDLRGHLIRHSEKSKAHRMKVDDILPGIYFLRISDGIGMEYRKVIVQ